ncbi:MAG: sugar phosphate isomerase/epimerase [Clostridiales bacterium]|nr:sugar phosphate isomerase/epimerase [Clostridiales bacterium]
MKLTKPIALQLYSVRFDMAKDFYGTLKKVADMGYDGVEFAGFYNEKAEDVKKACEDLNLVPISSHVVMTPLLINDLDAQIEYHKILGCKYIVMPYADENYRPGGPKFEEGLALYEKIGKKLKENGINFLYHNHDFEFIKYKDTNGFDYLYSAVSPEYLNPQMDVCWVSVAGRDPVEYIKKYSGRLDVLHLKDYILKDPEHKGNMYALIDENGQDDINIDVSESENFDFRPLGQGQVGINSIIDAAEQNGVKWYVVEQDRSSDMPDLEAAKKSIDYLRELQK